MINILAAEQVVSNRLITFRGEKGAGSILRLIRKERLPIPYAV